jgi:5-formyltetrahydrofolate cyclo-ligase
LCGKAPGVVDVDQVMVRERKKSLRAELRDQLRQLDAVTIKTRSRAAADRLVGLDVYDAAQTIMLFLPLRHEVDATPIAIRAWQAGKTVAVPLVSYEQRHMIAVEIRSLSEPMATDHYGLRTPVSQRPIPVESLDLVVVPGLAFDAQGGRLGRGGGFYDRFLGQRSFAGKACGYAFDEQLVESVPTTDTDVPLDLLVTDERVLQFNHRG